MGLLVVTVADEEEEGAVALVEVDGITLEDWAAGTEVALDAELGGG